MTQDQVHHRLCEMELLKEDVGKRTVTVRSEGVGGVVKVGEDGSVKGRARDGSSIELKTKGKSLARLIREGKTKRPSSKYSEGGVSSD